MKTCLKCKTNQVSNEVTICEVCSSKIFGVKGVDYDGNETESVCELAWGCRENCEECTCIDVK
jgi:hypothetical protein